MVPVRVPIVLRNASTSMSVVLPAPLAPMSAVSVPGSNDAVTPSRSLRSLPSPLLPSRSCVFFFFFSSFLSSSFSFFFAPPGLHGTK